MDHLCAGPFHNMLIEKQWMWIDRTWKDFQDHWPWAAKITKTEHTIVRFCCKYWVIERGWSGSVQRNSMVHGFQTTRFWNLLFKTSHFCFRTLHQKLYMPLFLQPQLYMVYKTMDCIYKNGRSGAWNWKIQFTTTIIGMRHHIGSCLSHSIVDICHRHRWNVASCGGEQQAIIVGLDSTFNPLQFFWLLFVPLRCSAHPFDQNCSFILSALALLQFGSKPCFTWFGLIVLDELPFLPCLYVLNTPIAMIDIYFSLLDLGLIIVLPTPVCLWLMLVLTQYLMLMLLLLLL